MSCVFLARFSQKLSSEWKPEIRLPSGSDHVMLKSLDWNAEYEVYVVAENQQGKSKAAHFVFRTSAQPTAIPGTTPLLSVSFPLGINAQVPHLLMCLNSPLTTRLLPAILMIGCPCKA